MSLKLMSIVGLLIMIVVICLLIEARCLVGNNIVAIAVQVLAIGLMIWARVTFGRRSFHAAGNPTEGGLVTSGPYRYIRHPIYAAALYLIWAGVISHLSLETLALGIFGIVGAGMRISVEERLVSERYPEYKEYAKRTRRIFPFVV